MYRCAVIIPEGGSIRELYHGCYLGYKPNQDINNRSHTDMMPQTSAFLSAVPLHMYVMTVFFHEGLLHKVPQILMSGLWYLVSGMCAHIQEVVV